MLHSVLVSCHDGAVDESRPELRIADRERRAVDAHLQQAHGDGVLTLTEYDERAALCWAARTQSDLDALVRDLPPYRPDPGEGPTQVVTWPTQPAAASGVKDRVQRLAGGVGGVLLAGLALFFGAQILTAADGTSLLGSRQVVVGPDQERVEVGALFGNVDVVVPDGVRARVAGRVVFGGTECERACSEPGREVVVEAIGAFAMVDVMRPGEILADEREEAREDAEDAAEDARERAEEAAEEARERAEDARDDG